MAKEKFVLADLLGKQFHYFTVIGKSFKIDDRGRKSIKCRCQCGVLKDASVSSLVSGAIKSCGCWNSEVVARRNYRHGLRHAAAYKTWLNMRNRVLNPNSSYYTDYGGRGISLCLEWEDYKKFHDWAMANGFEKGKILDRMDVNGNYCPGNCRFTDPLTSANNKRNNVRLEYSPGEFLTYAEAGRKYGVSGQLIRQRIVVHQATPLEAISSNRLAKNSKRRQNNAEVQN